MLEPRIVGIAKRNEIWVESILVYPRISAPVIQQPALDAPGMTAKHCQRPMEIASE